MLSCHEQGIRSALSTTEKVIILLALVGCRICFTLYEFKQTPLGSTSNYTIWEMDLSSVEQKAICG
jgi:hypothetical protein